MNCQKAGSGSQSFGFGRFGASPKSQTRLFTLYEKELERIVKVDASQSFSAVFGDVLAVLENRLGILK